jgi:D-cysteine desulfhydrase
MPASELSLLRAWPRLAQHLPRHAVLELPTPVEPLSIDGAPSDQVFVKRDDRCSRLIGGNKPRKLELLVGAAVARGSKRLVTTGGLGTHHGLATTILGRDAGLSTTLVLVRQPLTAEVQELLRLDAAYGARLLYAGGYGGGVPGAALQGTRALVGSTLAGERPFLVATGGSSTRGTVGIVSAGLELAEQVRAGVLPAPAQVWTAVGSGGTLAGLVAGLRLSGLPTRVVGVLVTDILAPSPRKLARAAHDVVRWLRRYEPAIPEVAVTSDDFELVVDHLGPGYGAATPEGLAAMEAAAGQGLNLEVTYTAKCLAALRDRATRGKLPNGPIVFWNTHNSVDVGAQAPRPPDGSNLPLRFRAFVEAPLD